MVMMIGIGIAQFLAGVPDISVSLASLLITWSKGCLVTLMLHLCARHNFALGAPWLGTANPKPPPVHVETVQLPPGRRQLAGLWGCSQG